MHRIGKTSWGPLSTLLAYHLNLTISTSRFQVGSFLMSLCPQQCLFLDEVSPPALKQESVESKVGEVSTSEMDRMKQCPESRLMVNGHDDVLQSHIIC